MPTHVITETVSAPRSLPFKVRAVTRKLLLAIAALPLALSVAQAQSNHNPEAQTEATRYNARLATFRPYDGTIGYDEFSLGPSSWYVASHASGFQNMDWVLHAWWLRVAQLCASVQASHVVQLRYPGEPVRLQDKQAQLDDLPAPRVDARVIFVPIFIPNMGPTHRHPVLRPSYSAPVLCVPSPQAVKDPQRAEALAPYVARAHAAGVKADDSSK